MNQITPYYLVRAMASISLVAIALQYWPMQLLGLAIILMPYLIVILLANKEAYSSPLRVHCRFLSGVGISIISTVLLFGIESDAQASIGVLFAVAIQFGIIFISEAIIGLFTYQESKP